MSKIGRSRSLRRGLTTILPGAVFALGSSDARAQYCIPQQITVDSAKLQIVKSPTNSKNQINLSATFTNYGDNGCAGRQHHLSATRFGEFFTTHQGTHSLIHG